MSHADRRRALREGLTALATAQGGLFSIAQARALGINPANAGHRLRSGTWERVVRGIYRLVGIPAGTHADATLASLWSAGRDGLPRLIFRGRSALGLRGLEDSPPKALQVYIGASRKRAADCPVPLDVAHAQLPASATVERLAGGLLVVSAGDALTELLLGGSPNLPAIRDVYLRARLAGAIGRDFWDAAPGLLPGERRLIRDWEETLKGG